VYVEPAISTLIEPLFASNVKVQLVQLEKEIHVFLFKSLPTFNCRVEWSVCREYALLQFVIQ
jgi:hypothetical protein